MTATIRISGILDADKEKLAQKSELLTSWLSKNLGRKVEFVPVSDEAAAVAGLAANKIDLAWLGGVAAVQAGEACKGKAWPIFAREADLKHKSYLIATKKLVDAGTFKSVAERNPMPLEQLAAMKPAFAGVSFTFGAKTSISGHLMPRFFLEKPEVGIDPEKGFKAKPGYALSGEDVTVLASVASGAFDLGVMDYLSWEQAKDEQKAQAPVIFVTEEYADYCMVGHSRNGPTLLLRVLTAFIRLDPKIEEQKAVLDSFAAKRFVSSGPEHLSGLSEILKSTKARGIPK